MVFRKKFGKPKIIDGTKPPPEPPAGSVAPPRPAAPPPSAAKNKTQIIDGTNVSAAPAQASAAVKPRTQNQVPVLDATSYTPDAAASAHPNATMMKKRRPDVMVQDYTQEKLQPKTDKAETLVEFVHVTNRLRKKVGEAATGFDPGVFLKAAEVVKNLASSYIDGIAPKEIRELGYTLQALEHFPEKNKEYISKLFMQSHEVKSGGGSYGYPLISRIGDSLCKLTEGMNAPEEMDMALIRMHMDALNIVVRKKIKGMGGEVGQLLAEGFEVVVAKRKAHDPSLVLGHVQSFLEKLDSA